MEWQTVGSYLGRDVRVVNVDPEGVSGFDDGLSSSLVLLVFGPSFAESRGKEAFLAKVLESAPLAMVFLGLGSRVAFDLTLELQSRLRNRRHTMTKASTATDPIEGVEDFLQATWPAEDRFSEWKLYSVLVVGGATLQAEVDAAIAAALE